MRDDVVARLAAANPVPTHEPFTAPEPLRVRRAVLVLALAVAVAAPAAAFAGRLADLLGLSNEGTPVEASSLDLSRDTALADALGELGFPSTLKLLGTRNGISFYAARTSSGHLCFALESAAAKGVGCDWRDDPFPSPTHPIYVFPPLRNFAGFAADGVAAVRGVDTGGRVVVSAAVADNLFASPQAGPFDDVVAIQALDAAGDVVATWRRPGRS